MRQMIEAAGAGLLYLSPCSPDFNPIENAFAKLKALQRKAAERSVDGLSPPLAGLSTASPRPNAKTTSLLPDAPHHATSYQEDSPRRFATDRATATERVFAWRGPKATWRSKCRR